MALAAAAVAAPSVVGASPVGTGEERATLGLRRAVTVAGIREHQAAFQQHADLSGGSRTGGSPGFEA